MAFYALGTVPLIQAYKVPQLHGEVWFANDATSAGNLKHLHTWWCNLNKKGPLYGYFPNGTKTWLIVKVGCEAEAVQLFQSSDVQITTDGRRHLGAHQVTLLLSTSMLKNKLIPG